MKQQVNIVLIFEVDTSKCLKSLRADIEDRLQQVESEVVGFVQSSIHEEAEIYSNDKQSELYHSVLSQIANEPLWGESKNVDKVACMEAGEWEDGHFCPSADTESSQLSHVVNLARRTLSIPK